MSLNLTQLTLDEIIKLQNSRSIFAVGKYQGVPNTLSGWISANNIPTTTIFDAATQEQFGTYLLTKKRPTVVNYVYQQGSVTLEQAQLELAKEFASIPVPYDVTRPPGAGGSSDPGGRPSKGQSYYEGLAGNKAGTTIDVVQTTLTQARNGKNLQLLKDFLSQFEGKYDSINIIPKIGDTVRAPQIGTDEYYAALVGNGAAAWEALRINRPIDPRLTIAGNLPANATITGDLDGKYIKEVYTDPLIKIAYPNVAKLLDDGTLKVMRITPSVCTPTDFLTLVREEAVTSVSDLQGEKELIQSVGQLSSEASLTKSTAAAKLSNNFLPSEQYFLVANNFFELYPDRMRNAMSVNTNISPSTGAIPNYSHAWRAPGKLAITANITIPGFAGFRIGQVFWVGRTYEHYKRYGAFQLFGITESIDVTKGWTTELYSRFNAIPQEKLLGLQSE